MVTFWERATHSINHMFSLMSICNFGCFPFLFQGQDCVCLTAPVPGHCFLFTLQYFNKFLIYMIFSFQVPFNAIIDKSHCLFIHGPVPGPEVTELFSCSSQLSMKFILLINVKKTFIVGILTFISRINDWPI